MATGVASWSTTAASNSTADSNVNWAEGQAPSSVNDSARALMASVAKYRDDVEGSLTTAGTSTAFTVTTGQSFASLAALDGNKLCLKFNATNGASPTLAVDGLAAKAIQTASGTAVATGAILADSVHNVTYVDSIPAFLLQDNLRLITTALTTVDITGAPAETAPAAADELPIYDASAAANRKMTLANLLKVITSLTAEAAPATDDELALYDTSGTSTDKITLANLLKVVDALTEDTSPDEAADFLLSYDTSAGAAKKVKPDNIVPTAANGAAWVLISAQDASSSATINFTGLDGIYDAFEIRISGAKPATDDVDMWMRVGTGAGPTYQAGATAYYWQSVALRGAGSAGVGDSADSKMILTFFGGGVGIGNATGENFNAVITFNNPDAADFCEFAWQCQYVDTTGIPVSTSGGGHFSTAGAITAVRFLMESGNIASGRFSLLGLKRA